MPVRDESKPANIKGVPPELTQKQITMVEKGDSVWMKERLWN